jgi:hypothetical protein
MPLPTRCTNMLVKARALYCSSRDVGTYNVGGALGAGSLFTLRASDWSRIQVREAFRICFTGWTGKCRRPGRGVPERRIVISSGTHSGA